MALKKGLPLWLAVTLFLLLAALLAIAMISEMSDVRSKMSADHTAAHRAHHAPAHTVARPETTPPLVDEPVQAPEPEISDAGKAAGIALILDDAGYDLPELQRMLKLGVPVAIAVIPDAPYARKAAIMAHQAGHVVMLHLPMQPVSEKYSHRMTDAFLTDRMNEMQLRRTFISDLAMVPYVEGVNNHMGSALTQLEKPMHWVMQVCLEKGLFFVDSVTSGKSVAGRVATEMGLERGRRQFFLDNNLDTAALANMWEKVRICARKGHRCVVIGHPHKQTVTFLENNISADDRTMIVPLKQLLHPASLLTRQGRNRMAVARP